MIILLRVYWHPSNLIWPRVRKCERLTNEFFRRDIIIIIWIYSYVDERCIDLFFFNFNFQFGFIYKIINTSLVVYNAVMVMLDGIIPGSLPNLDYIFHILSKVCMYSTYHGLGATRWEPQIYAPLLGGPFTSTFSRDYIFNLNIVYVCMYVHLHFRNK